MNNNYFIFHKKSFNFFEAQLLYFFSRLSLINSISYFLNIVGCILICILAILPTSLHLCILVWFCWFFPLIILNIRLHLVEKKIKLFFLLEKDFTESDFSIISSKVIQFFSSENFKFDFNFYKKLYKFLKAKQIRFF